MGDTAACHVRGCRHPATHTTAGHRCGRCSLYGHGVIECGDRGAIGRLRDAFHAPHASVDAPCDVPGCTHPWTHTTAAHHCPTCGARCGACACANAATADAAAGAGDDDRTVAFGGTSPRRRCPLCRVVSAYDPARPVHTGGECCVCMDVRPCVVFAACRHATVCAACAERLDED